MADACDLDGAAVLQLVRDRLVRHPVIADTGSNWPPMPDDASHRSADWSTFVAANDVDRWSSWARALERAGRHRHADAVAATARWFDPSLSTEAIVGERSPELRDRLGPSKQWEQWLPLTARNFRHLHWLGWAAWIDGHERLPFAMEHACDESFSIRTRMYRSLGHMRHVAAVPVLRESLHDPHPFARAQAARSLGWLRDPTTFDALRALARRDRSAEVRRSATLAVQRILGYWTYYGEWNDIMDAPSRIADVVRDLALRGLHGYAHELCGFARDDETSQLTALRTVLAPHSLETRHTNAHSYHWYFDEAERIEVGLDRADLSLIPRWLAGSDCDLVHALDVISWHRLRDYEARAVAFAEEPGALGWTARRTLRRLGRGAWLDHDQLRLLP